MRPLGDAPRIVGGLPAPTRWVHLLREQWDRIDAQYKADPLPSSHAAAVLVTAALSLALANFFGGHDALERMPGGIAILDAVEHPDLARWLYWSAFKLVSYGLLP